MNRRISLLVVAALVAALGAGLVFAYVNGVNDRALRNQHAVYVQVAKTLIPTGTTAADAESHASFELKKFARDSVVPGALGRNDLSLISGKQALAPIFPGQQIMAVQWGTLGTTSELPLKPGQVAVSVKLDDPNRVAGFVQPGSNVAVFATVNPIGGGNASQTTRVLLPTAQVVAVGPTTFATTSTKTASGATNTESLPKAILTLGLGQRDAQRLILASQTGTLYFALLSGNTTLNPGVVVNQLNLFG